MKTFKVTFTEEFFNKWVGVSEADMINLIEDHFEIDNEVDFEVSEIEVNQC
jgi:hypothetical protein